MSSRTISIVTPSYNQGSFLEETLRSVLAQEGDFHLDYLVMDGGSTDDSMEIIRKYDRLLRNGEWEKRCLSIEFRWVGEKDGGQVDAIQRGFRMARGQIASWLNSDDVYSDHQVLKRVQAAFDADPAAEIVTGDGRLIDRAGKPFGYHRVDELNLSELIYLDYHILQPATFLAEDVYRAERLDPSYNYCFDAEYFIRLFLNGRRFVKVNDLFANFRLYPETKTVSGTRRRHAEAMAIARKHGTVPAFYPISWLYRYFSFVLAARRPDSRIIGRATRLLQLLAYRTVLKRWNR